MANMKAALAVASRLQGRRPRRVAAVRAQGEIDARRIMLEAEEIDARRIAIEADTQGEGHRS